MRYWVFCVVLIFCGFSVEAQKRNVSKKKKGVKEVRYDSLMVKNKKEQIYQLTSNYNFEKALQEAQNLLPILQRQQETTNDLEQEIMALQQAKNMLSAVQEVLFIDSLVVDKKELLNTLRVEDPIAFLPVSEAINIIQQKELLPSTGAIYYNKFTHQILLPLLDNKRKRIALLREINKQWSSPLFLDGLIKDQDQDFPFLLSDGNTLYYAAKGKESIGGYDIFVTRYNRATGQYLQPENIGMPFNSLANDYLYYIDENTGLGYFVTDRNQPEDKVCIYTFLPNEQRKIINQMGFSEEEIKHFAQLHSIKDTQYLKASLSKAEQRLQALAKHKESQNTIYLNFVLNDDKILNTLSDFSTKEAYEKALKWYDIKQRLQIIEERLNLLRLQYVKDKATLKQEILNLEQERKTLGLNLQQIAQQIRKLEIQHKK